MSGGDDLLRSISPRNAPHVEDAKAKEGHGQVAHSVPEQSRSEKVVTDTTEQQLLLNREVKTQFTVADLNALFEKAKSTYERDGLDVAMDLFELAANHGHLGSQNVLIRIYKDKNELAKYFHYLQMSAPRNLIALAELAEAYEKGRGVEIDTEKAKRLYFKAARQNEKRGGSVSAKEYSTTYVESAIDCYGRALRLGYQKALPKKAECHSKLAGMYEDGGYLIQAVRHYQKALDLGYTDALSKIANCYFTLGEEAEKNIHVSRWHKVQALDYYWKASQENHPNAKEKVIKFASLVAHMYEKEGHVNNIRDLADERKKFALLTDLYISGAVHPELPIGDCIKKFFSIVRGQVDIISRHPGEIIRMLVKLIFIYHESLNVADKEQALTYCKNYMALYEASGHSMLFTNVDFVQSSMKELSIELAEMYENGTGGVEQDKDKAYDYYAKAILGGYELPETKVTEIYDYYMEKGLILAEKPTLEDKLKARTYFDYLIRYKNLYPDAQMDYPPAGKLYFEIAQIYEGKTDRLVNIENASQYYESAREWGEEVSDSIFAELNFRFGHLYELGIDVEIDKAKALDYYEAAMDKGHVEARFKYGVMHIQGEGILPNQVVGYTHLQTAAEMGHVDAIFWMVEQAENHNDPMAQLTLGAVFKQGVNGAPDLDQAIHFYEMAEKQNVPEASLALGEIYLALNNFAEAVRHYQLGSERDHVECHRKLANLFYNGAQGVDVNKHLALQYFERLAFVGDAEAQYMAGLIYYRGEDPIFTGPLYERAVRHFNDAALQNHKEAEYILATMYLENKGVNAYLSAAERKERAVSLLKRATEHGSEEAKEVYYKLLHENESDRLD